MKILVVGGGGREHALAWKIGASPLVDRVLVAPGNAGTAGVGENVPVPADDVEGLVELARARGVDLVVVGPEAALVAGLSDRLCEAGIPCVGPGAAAARIEGSKAFAKALMAQAGVPTAEYAVFDDLDLAQAYVRAQGAPIVVKADGLAAGKGVTVASTVEEALEAVRECLEAGRFGAAGREVLIEECLEGVETSYMVLTDGETLLPLPTSMDHKRLLDGDAGPNTGGMGAISPSPHLDSEQEEAVMDAVMRPVVAALSDGGRPYRGFLYAGLMLSARGAKVLEFNCRLGDPETQALMMRIDGDLVPLLMAAATGDLAGRRLPLSPGAAAVVVMASEGYPGPYAKGRPIFGLDAAGDVDGVRVFHAGTAMAADGAVATSGGRVLGVAGRGPNLGRALERAYAGVDRVDWDGAVHRTDIGAT